MWVWLISIDGAIKAYATEQEARARFGILKAAGIACSLVRAAAEVVDTYQP